MSNLPAQERLLTLLKTPEGERLLALLQADGGNAMRQAGKAIQAGNADAAKAQLSPLLQSPELQRLLKSMEKAMEHG